MNSQGAVPAAMMTRYLFLSQWRVRVRSVHLGRQQIAALEDLMPHIQAAQYNLGTMGRQRNAAIRTALGASARIKDVTTASGLSRQRIEQIKVM